MECWGEAGSVHRPFFVFTLNPTDTFGIFRATRRPLPQLLVGRTCSCPVAYQAAEGCRTRFLHPLAISGEVASRQNLPRHWACTRLHKVSVPGFLTPLSLSKEATSRKNLPRHWGAPGRNFWQQGRTMSRVLPGPRQPAPMLPCTVWTCRAERCSGL